MSAVPENIFLADYREPDFAIARVELDFALNEETTMVTSRLSIEPRRGAPKNQPLFLNGEDLELVSVAIDGRPLAADAYETSNEGLTVFQLPMGAFTLEASVQIRPQDNTKLEGLYKSSGNYCTQCEAEGYRRITYHLDRPDVTSVYSVRIEAEKARYPVLLSNGNPVGSGEAKMDDTGWNGTTPIQSHPIYLPLWQVTSRLSKIPFARSQDVRSRYASMSNMARRADAGTRWSR